MREEGCHLRAVIPGSWLSFRATTRNPCFLMKLNLPAISFTMTNQLTDTKKSRLLWIQLQNSRMKLYLQDQLCATILSQSWSQRKPLLVLDEIHKMPQWESWLKAVFNGRPQSLSLVKTRPLAARHHG